MSSSSSLLRGTAVVLVAGSLGWLAAALPWLLEGGRLPISSAWPSVVPDAGPWVALPAGEHRLSALLVTCGLVGVVPVVVGHLLRRSLWPGVAGALVAATLSIGDTWRTIDSLSGGSRGAELLVAAHLGLALLGLLVGLVVAIASCRGPRWLRTTARGAVATVLVSWVLDLVVTDPISISGWQTWVIAHQQHLLAAVLAVVLAVAGWRPLTTLLGWLGALAVVWVIPAGLTALTYLGSYAGGWASTSAGQSELVDGALDVLRAALDPTNRPVWPLAAALVAGAGGAAVLALVRSRRAGTAAL
ncbi:hypothetical protein ASG73_11240 [Janibacter sp. Soil728]|uniref:hypothetical protein n=1 Tax=Janibacter sp. Soil728 TaxID=1736393 RepID=UPI0006F42D85|nr:hypothetical protein [Janibacter sp. Soil728]KRE36899.1 hypothetical protein ASG73_11240 [Janibacter sp. Soil728]